jgi:AraC-like DNA-binding protein
MSFGMGANALRFPAALLDHRPDTADPTNVKFVEDQCRRELAHVGLPTDLVAQVRAELRVTDDGYATLTEVAEALHLSTRTLKRRLRDHGTSFNELLDGARRAEAIRLLTTTSLPIEQVTRRLGYSDPRSFRRAFQGWTGSSPGRFRDGHRTRDSSR